MGLGLQRPEGFAGGDVGDGEFGDESFQPRGAFLHAAFFADGVA